MRFGPGMDIARGQRMRDPPRLAQQQTAGLAGESGARFGQHALMNTERNWQTILGSEFRSEEHTSELQSLMRISYAVFCLKKKKLRTTAIYIIFNIHTTMTQM